MAVNQLIFLITVLLALFCCLKTKKEGSINRWDIIFLLSSWEPFNLGFWGAAISPFFLYAWRVSAAILILLSLFYLYRRGIKLGVSISWPDFLTAGQVILTLALILIPLGLYLNFLHFRPRLESALVLPAIGFFLLVAPSEELVFRGILQNLLVRTFKSRWLGLAVTSVLFATIYTHICGHRVCPNWNYVGLAFIAGLGYGWSYLKSRNILVPIFVHGLVDSLWLLLFRG